MIYAIDLANQEDLFGPSFQQIAWSAERRIIALLNPELFDEAFELYTCVVNNR